MGLSVDGKIQKLYGSLRDITERKEAEEALLESKERLQLVTQAASLGSYDWQINTGVLHWDEQMHRLFGLDRNDPIDKNQYFAQVLHPEDVERMGKAIGVRPFGLDVCSGVRSNGNLDNRLLDAFVTAMRQADETTASG